MYKLLISALTALVGKSPESLVVIGAALIALTALVKNMRPGSRYILQAFNSNTMSIAPRFRSYSEKLPGQPGHSGRSHVSQGFPAPWSGNRNQGTRAAGRQTCGLLKKGFAREGSFGS